MKKDQLVIACIESPDSAPLVIHYARTYAEHLRHKGLMLLHVAPENADTEWVKQYNIPYVALHGEWHTAISGLPTVFSGILAVAAVDPKAPRTSFTHPRTLLRAFRDCKTAYLCVDINARPRNAQPRTAALTLDYYRESKEKLIWASYLVRFLAARLTIATPSYRDTGLLERQHNNLRFADKFFHAGDLNINYTTQPIPHSTFTPDDLQTLTILQPDLLIALTTDTRQRDLADLLFSPTELRLLRHPSRTPLLFLNQRDDLYVLCD